jgi:hypothetical protein
MPVFPLRPDQAYLRRSIVRSPIDFLRHRIRRVRFSRQLERSQARAAELVFVYAHPRTGSLSMSQALGRSEGVATFHVHNISREHTFWRSSGPIVAEDGVVCGATSRAEAARSWMDRGRIRCVVPVRDPVAVNISFFLYWMNRWWAPREWSRLDRFSDAEFARLFLDRYPHFSSTRWMDREFGTATGLAFGPDTFDRERGAGILENDRVSALVLRTELPDATRTREVAEFLQRPISPIQTHNSSEQVLKDRADLVARTRRVIAAIPGYVDAILDTEHAARFWTADQVESFRRKWRAVADGSPGRRDG